MNRFPRSPSPAAVLHHRCQFPRTLLTPTPPAAPPDDDFPTPHKTFAKHFPDPLYLDQAEEFAPFGTDEGADTLWVWNMRRPELTKCTTMLWIIKQEDEAGALEDPKSNSPDVDGFIVGAGFALILFTGHIASEGKRLVLDALQRTRSYHTTGKPRELAVMSRDLKRFPATDCTKP